VELFATAARHLENHARLGEAMSPRKAPFQNGSSAGTQHSLGIPPAGAVHLAMSGDNETEFEEAVEV
jgi:hypothetical protein